MTQGGEEAERNQLMPCFTDWLQGSRTVSKSIGSSGAFKRETGKAIFLKGHFESSLENKLEGGKGVLGRTVRKVLEKSGGDQ